MQTAYKRAKRAPGTGPLPCRAGVGSGLVTRHTTHDTRHIMTFTKLLRLAGAFTLLAFVATLITILASGQGSGYNAQRSFSTTVVLPDIAISEQSSILYHQVAWITTGTPATCTVSIDSSSNGVTWTTGGIIAGQNCTSTGNSTVTAASAAFVRINVTAFSGGTSPVVSVNYTGWSYNPSGGGGGSGTVGSCAAAGNAYYATSGTTTSCDTSLVDSGSGGLTFANGTAIVPTIIFANSSAYGFYSPSAGNIGLATGSVSHDSEVFTNTGATKVISGGLFGWTTSATDATGSVDTSISRSAADVLAVGNTSGTPDTSGKVKAAGYMSVGTTFTSGGGCTESTLVGGATAGKFASGTTGSCATTITMGNSASAPNGWICNVADISTAIAGVTSASTQTTATISVTTTSGNTVAFSCMGY